MANTPAPTDPDKSLHELTQRIAEMIQSLRFGSIEIVVHDRRVVMVTRTEKVKVSELP